MYAIIIKINNKFTNTQVVDLIVSVLKDWSLWFEKEAKPLFYLERKKFNVA
ncbi:hypothetical protein PPHE_b0687 [Pseudoalteromonas phenolica O-BC30]|nr:hypothetical protein [Pseudoalteromonas phenolica O-BC30]